MPGAPAGGGHPGRTESGASGDTPAGLCGGGTGAGPGLGGRDAAGGGAGGETCILRYLIGVAPPEYVSQ